jgi:hypothetical protein
LRLNARKKSVHALRHGSRQSDLLHFHNVPTPRSRQESLPVSDRDQTIIRSNLRVKARLPPGKTPPQGGPSTGESLRLRRSRECIARTLLYRSNVAPQEACIRARILPR